MPFRAVGALLLSLSLIGAVNAAGVGDPAPELKVKEWLNTTPLTLASLKDKTIVLEFWATWCPPCVASIPHVIELNNKYKDKNVVVIGLTSQKKDKIEGFAKDRGMTYAIGTASSSFNDYGVSTIPSAFVISHGEIYWRGHPDQSLDVAIQAALRSNKPAAQASQVQAKPVETATPEVKPAVAETKPAVTEAPKPAPTAAPATEILHEVVYVMKDGRRIEADQAVESGEEWAVKDKAGKFQMLKKTDVAEMKM